MVRVDPAQSDALVATTKATPMNMRGRDMPGWLGISADDLSSDDQLAPSVKIGTGYACPPATAQGLRVATTALAPSS